MIFKSKILLGVFLSIFPLIATVEQASGATKQTFKWSASGACVDLVKNDKIEYTLYESNTCDFKVTVNPANPSRIIALQFFDKEAGVWTIGGQATTNKKGVTRLGVIHTVKDGDCGDDNTLQFRLQLAKKGSSKAQTSESFWITYMMEECK